MNMPNSGAGCPATRQDAARFRAMFDPNPVTRHVCREMWLDWIERDMPGPTAQVERMQRTVDTHSRGIESLNERLREIVQCLP